MLFNIAINSLLVRLADAEVKIHAYADDIGFFASSKNQLIKAIKIVESWNTETNIALNKEKSAILVLRVDRRTPKFELSHICGIPVVTEVKYLGVILDDCGDAKP